jgi:hypothetical protein
MEMDKAPKPPSAGIIYGKIAYWLAMVGMIIVIAGSAIYLTSGGYLNKVSLFDDIWRGDAVRTIWAECAGAAAVPHGYWYLGRLAQGDCLVMLGIAVACVAGVIGMWGAVFGLLRSKGGIYIIFALMVAIILTLSASGIITIQ